MDVTGKICNFLKSGEIKKFDDQEVKAIKLINVYIFLINR